MIVGAGEGLGRSLAATFARNGCDLALISRSEAGMDATRRAVRAVAPGACVIAAVADAERPDELEAAIARIEAMRGSIDILIYNVRAMTPLCAPLEMSYKQLERSLRLEAVGALAAAKAVLPGMIVRGRGTLIFSSATAAFRGSATHPLYSIGKFALRGLAQSLARAYASRGVHVAHVRIDCALDVPMMRALALGDAKSGRLASPDSIAEAYWSIHCQPAAAWSNEVELRPSAEPWTF
ncbi:SDR family NAD(P)-dependent oxidoreductase [Bradyrhizobium sp.]|uniref:SDR family NAD(P)-dependent oxidoreductase n=1 Tax=Bradyrhizobium sp. TaxID=376 RepID=UPI001DAF4F62|nr:SDR family NAD(P)-dependent oxidoreductase [Bradyrhizobium sp.]MBI5321992.1 SDR family NAD(P)-dependent oxidoreductase [Bradyrhizobium sp.]